MVAGASPAVARHRLRLAIREAREAKDITQRQVAQSLEWSLAKVNRIEAGDVTVSRTDLQALLQLLDVTDTNRIEELMAQARASRQRGWWDHPHFRTHLTPAVIQSLQFELDATEIRSFQPNVVPGALQTREYAWALLASSRLPDRTQEARTAFLDARLRRREHLLTRPDPPDFLVVLDESVLMREVGGPQVLSDQLYDLLDTARADRVLVRVLPFTHPGTYAAFGLFTIYDCGNEDVALVYRESYEADEAVIAADSIRRHRGLFEQIWEQSLSVERSIRLIEASAASMRSAADRLQPSL